MKTILLSLLSLITFAEFEIPSIPAGNQMKCFKKSCSLVGRWDCKDDWDRRKLLDSCTRQQDLNCIKTSLKSLSSFEADDVFEVSKINKSCQYVDSLALKKSLRFVKSYEYDDLNEVSSFNDAHWLTSKDCLEDTYFKIKTFNLDISDFKSVARNCGGSYEKGCLIELCKNRGSFGCDEVEEVREVLKSCVFPPLPHQRRKL